MKALEDNSRMVGPLLGTKFCMMLKRDGYEDRIDPAPLMLSPGERVLPGTRFTKIGSKESSAGNQPVFMDEGAYWEYLGFIRSLDGNLAVFDQQPNWNPYLITYWYYLEDGTGYFNYFTQACAGRQLKLTDCSYRTPDVINETKTDYN